jgi:hypothetical protein
MSEIRFNTHYFSRGHDGLGVGCVEAAFRRASFRPLGSSDDEPSPLWQRGGQGRSIPSWRSYYPTRRGNRTGSIIKPGSDGQRATATFPVSLAAALQRLGGTTAANPQPKTRGGRALGQGRVGDARDILYGTRRANPRRQALHLCRAPKIVFPETAALVSGDRERHSANLNNGKTLGAARGAATLLPDIRFVRQKDFEFFLCESLLPPFEDSFWPSVTL